MIRRRSILVILTAALAVLSPILIYLGIKFSASETKTVDDVISQPSKISTLVAHLVGEVKTTLLHSSFSLSNASKVGIGMVSALFFVGVVAISLYFGVTYGTKSPAKELILDPSSAGSDISSGNTTSSSRGGLSVDVIVGIVVGSVAGLALLGLFLFFSIRSPRISSEGNDDVCGNSETSVAEPVTNTVTKDVFEAAFQKVVEKQGSLHIRDNFPYLIGRNHLMISDSVSLYKNVVSNNLENGITGIPPYPDNNECENGWLFEYFEPNGTMSKKVCLHKESTLMHICNTLNYNRPETDLVIPVRKYNDGTLELYNYIDTENKLCFKGDKWECMKLEEFAQLTDSKAAEKWITVFLISKRKIFYTHKLI
jgi:hypothetical protein